MGELSFRRLAVIETPMADAAVRRTDGQFAAIKLSSGTEAVLGGFVYELKGENHELNR